MVAVVKRMRKMSALLNIKTGPGAAVLPREVTRIHMEFAAKLNGGHMGPRKFWQRCLPRLKFHNPAIPMTVTRRQTDPEGPSQMTIHFTNAAHSTDKPEIISTTSAHTSTGPVPSTVAGAPTERVETIDMRNRSDSEILKQLLDVTKAKEVEIEEEDVEKLRELAEFRARSERDSAQHHKANEEKRRKEVMLNAARGMDVTGA